jgi:hypothetical protein
MQGSNKVDVIAAVGGIVSLQAAVQAATELPAIKIPILFMEGRDFGIAHANISGGINLDIPTYNQDRVNALRSAPYNAKKIGLLVNDNAAMGRDEATGWDPNNWGPVQKVGMNQANSQINLPNAINALAAIADGIVVASDPFFTSKRNQLVALLNPTNKPVCYPFDNYRNAGGGAAGGRSLRFGVNLDDQYTALGMKAKSVLAALSTHPATIPNVGVDRIPNTAVPW